MPITKLKDVPPVLPSIHIDGSAKTVYIGKLVLYFSFDTLIAFKMGTTICVRQNDWNNTTGKHINTVDGGGKNTKLRLAREDFLKAYKKIVGKSLPKGTLTTRHD